MAEPSFSTEEQRVFSKVSRRLLWFMLLLFMVNFVDRTNVGFAGLTMIKDIGISQTTFALSFTCFSIAYFLFEIPSNLILERVGARLWLARIALTWGIASTLCMFIVGAWSLIGLRVALGIAEAGFAPGSVLYMTYWFPQYYRARAHTKYFLAQPIAIALGSIVSGALLSLNGALGLHGWQWLFLIEGLPSIVMGVIAFFYLTDRPKDAKWLTESERTTLIAALKRDADERDRRAPPTARGVTREILTKDFQLICFAYGCLIGNASALGTWLPQIVRELNRPGMPYWMIGLITAVPSIAAICTMPLWTRHADRTKERFWHCVLPMLAGAVGWAMAAGLTSPVWRLSGLVLANICTIAAWPVYFTLPSMVLPPKAHAAGIAYLNVIGIAGTAVTPLIMGVMKDWTGTFTASMLSMGGVFVIGALAMFLVPRHLIAHREDGAPYPATAAAGS